MICSGCAEESPPGARFCMHCATPFPATCASCGEQLPAVARFCPGCAAPVDGVAPKAAASRPAAPERSPRDYTPKHLADKILRSKSALEGERKHVSVMFADVKGSMELAEQLEPEAWHQILDRFFQILSDGVHRFEGTVNQYTGDGIMALFGAPIAHEDHAARACYAALWLKDQLRDYADEVRRRRGVSFSVRIGINSGEVVVGKIGDDLRMDYTAQGLTVGLAQRMETLAAGESAYLTEHTAKWVEGFFDLRDLGAFDIKGVSEPLGVFELQGTGALRTRLELSRQRGFSRFVGRADEVGALDAALQRAIEGQGGVVGVVADAGVGKSRLCLEFLERCRARKVPVFQAHCPAHGKLIPLLPILELLRDFYGVADEDSDQIVREKVAGRLLLLDRDLEPLLPLAFDFLGVADPSRPLEGMDPARRQREMIVFTRRLIQAISNREPSVVLVDDVHWIDGASDEFLAKMAETVAGTRVLLLLNFRPEYTAEWMGDASYQQLPLRPLGPEAIEELVMHLLGSDASTRKLPALIRERSAGNPFFIEEIVQSLVESGRLIGERGAYRLEGSVESLRVPSSVQAILAARIDRLGEREKNLLQTAAAVGRRFSEPLLRRVCDLTDRDFDDAVGTLKRVELIREEALYPVVEYAFRHPLTHEVALGSQLADARSRVHARIAEALEEIHADHLDEESALIAHHWDAAGEAKPAALFHRRAGEHIAGGNPAAAQRHWYRVRDLSDQLDDDALAAELGQRSRLMILEYGWRLAISEEEASALFAEGEALAERRGDKRALAELCNAYCIPSSHSHGKIDKAVGLAERGLALAREVGDEVLAFALELRRYFALEAGGRTYQARLALEESKRHSREVMEQASALVGYYAPAAPVGFEGWSNFYEGRFDAVLDRLHEAADAAREHGSMEVVCWMRQSEATLHTLLGDPSRASRLGHEALEIAEQSESAISIVLSLEALCGHYLSAKDFDAALSMGERGLSLPGAYAPAEPVFHCWIAGARLGRGELQAARESAERALEIAAGRSRRAELLAHTFLAEVALAERGAHARSEVEEHLLRADSLAREFGNLAYLPRIFELRARAAEAARDLPAASAAQREELAFWQARSVANHSARLEAEIARIEA